MPAITRRRLLGNVVGMALLASAMTTSLYADHSWGSYHWARQSNPFTLELGDNVSDTWEPYLNGTSADWTYSNVLDTAVVPGGTAPKKCRPTSGRVEVCSETYGYNGWLGLAQIWVGGGHITQAITKVNDSYFNLATYDTPAWRNLVMCQEVGHAFGLDHQDENFNNTNLGSCMDYTSNPDGPPDNYQPNGHDYEQLETIYAHLDEPSGGGGGRGRGNNRMPPAMTDLDFNSPAQWGRLVRGSRERGISLYELDFGAGNKIFTFVIWARPDAR